MKIFNQNFLLFIFTAFFSATSHAQILFDETDKCGHNSPLAKSTLQALGDHWGYSYDSLLVDLEEWSSSPYITIDSLGASVQNRALWQLTITSDDTIHTGKQTVFFHARTHPNEVQSFWVTDQVITQLTAETEFAEMMRKNCVFYVIPMYNPDGVELEYPRQNANGIDIESNWDDLVLEPEVQVLKARFEELMGSGSPIKVAMNMHSAYGQHRYFWCHDSVGTSPEYLFLEQEYIEGVRYYYPNGIEPWNFAVSWTSGTSLQYPESWFWLNHQEAVMALTYEDWNNAAAGNFDLTANALLRGIADYLEIEPSSIHENQHIVQQFELFQNYPNPFNPATTIRYNLQSSGKVNLNIYDAAGRKSAALVNKFQPAGSYSLKFNGSHLAGGLYIVDLRFGSQRQSRKMVLLK